jgi:hypothetical protein
MITIEYQGTTIHCDDMREVREILRFIWSLPTADKPAKESS